MHAESRERRLGLLLGFQFVALLVAALVPFGFDHPSSWGLDFDHFLGLGALYLAAWLYGLALSVSLRRWLLLAGQIALPASFAALALTGVLGL
jgi:hypothetical protein